MLLNHKVALTVQHIYLKILLYVVLPPPHQDSQK